MDASNLAILPVNPVTDPSKYNVIVRPHHTSIFASAYCDVMNRLVGPISSYLHPKYDGVAPFYAVYWCGEEYDRHPFMFIPEKDINAAKHMIYLLPPKDRIGWPEDLIEDIYGFVSNITLKPGYARGALSEPLKTFFKKAFGHSCFIFGQSVCEREDTLSANLLTMGWDE